MARTKDIPWDANAYTATYENAVDVIESFILPRILSQIPLKRGARVLECGIGSGKWAAAFALLGYKVYAMDNVFKMLQRARNNFPNILFQTIVRDIRDPPLMDTPVDLIFNEGVIEHFLDDEERRGVLTNFYDAVKGYVSLIVPYQSEEENEIYYTPQKLKAELIAVGFHILDAYCIVFTSGDGKTIRKLIGINAERK